MLKKILLWTLMLVGIVFIIPAICLTLGKLGFIKTDRPKPEKIAGTPVETTAAAPQNANSLGREAMDSITVYDTETKTVNTINFSQYLACVVSSEMPITFEPEALKAQAVAARTYILQRTLYYQKNGAPPEHHGAMACTDSTHCQAFHSKEKRMQLWGKDAEQNWQKVADAVHQTAGIIMTYNGQPINAVFHAMSSGTTESAQNVWGSDVPYLQAVSSPLDKNAPRYETDISLTKEQLKDTLAQHIAGADFSQGIFGAIDRSPSGGIITIVVGNVRIKGSDFRKILNLRSTNIQFAVEGDTVRMTVFGYGHGVGMSQYGANFLAQQGKTYQQILTSYYTGVCLTPYTP